jgi:hypothetical protein
MRPYGNGGNGWYGRIRINRFRNSRFRINRRRIAGRHRTLTELRHS